MRRPLPVALLLCLLSGCGRSTPHAFESHHTSTISCRLWTDPEPLRLLVMDFDRMEVVEASAFFNSGGGQLVTCAHVVAGGTPLGVVLPDGRRLTVTEVAADPESDLALLRADGSGSNAGMSVAPVEPGTALRAVTKDGITAVTCVGSAVDADVGEVIAFEAGGLGPGASGGALINATGSVVGVIRGGFEDGAGEGVAVPTCRLMALLAEAADALREDACSAHDGAAAVD